MVIITCLATYDQTQDYTDCEWKQGAFLRRKSLLTVLEGFASLLSIKCVILLQKSKKLFQIGSVFLKALMLKTFSWLSALNVSKLTGKLLRLARG